ncbi:MAG: NAD(P)/FAD-dependent oxidoreductase [Thermodesulfobacteriota bacterium]
MHVAIIGNGITGVSAAIRIRQLKPDWKITMVSGESDYHYSRPALMYIFMGHMRYEDTKPYENHFWKKNSIDLLRDWVTEIDTQNKQLKLHKKGTLGFDKLLVAAGSKSNKFGWPGQDLDGVQGLYDLLDLKLLYENCKGAKNAVIVGGGLIGIEFAEMLHSRNIHVTFLVREQSYWNNVLPKEESEMINKIIIKEGMELQLETELREIVDNGSGRVKGVVTNKDEFIECEIVGLTAGVSSNIDLVKNSSIKTGRGILVDFGFRTNVNDIYAAGDCAEIVAEGGGRNMIQQVWYTGKMQGKAAGETICGLDSKYDPGIWYNSAKFLDLEYQTYGFILSAPQEGEDHLYWEHENNLHAIRIVSRGGYVTGINVMGIRYKHKVCESWIKEKKSLEYVLDNMKDANFDPEFYVKFETEIIKKFKKELAA